MNDFLENMESAAELIWEEATAGVPEGHFRCVCGQVEEISYGQPISNSPYAMPVCRFCFERRFNK